MILYPLDCNPRVLFFKMGFWVGVNSKNASKSGLFDQKVGVYSRKTPKTGLFTFSGTLFKSGPVGLQLSGNGIQFKKLTASISGSNFVGVHWISNVVNFVMQIKIPIPVQKIMPHTIEELKKKVKNILYKNDITIHR